jgi:hypothetical protein
LRKDSVQDERELGTFSDFMLGMAFGLVAPVFSSAAIFGMETSQLMRYLPFKQIY